MKRQHLCMMAVSLIMAICMCFVLAACNSDSGEGTHTHNWSETYTQNGATGHYRTCDGCEEQDKEAHVYTDDSDKTCDKCGYERELSTPVNHSHDYDYTDNQNGTHSAVCKGEGECTEPIENVSHKFVNGTCVCGATEPDVPVHSHDYEYTDNDDGTHSAVCKGEGECTEPIENEEHKFVNGTCVCGATEPDVPVHSHDYEYTDNEDGTHSAVCNGEGECNEPIENEEHEFVNGTCVCGATEVPEPEVTLAEPTFTIDRNGKVTIAKHPKTENFKYVIGTPEDLEEAYIDETISTLATTEASGEIQLTDGQAIAILAVGYTAQNGTVYKDSPCTEPATYKAPAGAFDNVDADYVEISLSTTADGKVDVVWAHDAGETFEIVLNVRNVGRR